MFQKECKACFAKLSLFCLLVTVGGCAGKRPLNEYSQAYTAIEAAKKHGATSATSFLWYHADKEYTQGQRCFEVRDYVCSRKHFIKARHYAERAENRARIERHQSGEVNP